MSIDVALISYTAANHCIKKYKNLYGVYAVVECLFCIVLGLMRSDPIVRTLFKCLLWLFSLKKLFTVHFSACDFLTKKRTKFNGGHHLFSLNIFYKLVFFSSVKLLKSANTLRRETSATFQVFAHVCIYSIHCHYDWHFVIIYSEMSRSGNGFRLWFSQVYMEKSAV